jgi:poly-gamma-glutamate synthesis protein (capsule biosynthesis protein)
VTVRDPGYTPRTPGAGGRRPSWLLPAIVGALVLGIGVGLVATVLGGPGASAGASAAPTPGAVAAATAAPPRTEAPSADPGASGEPEPSPGTSASPSPAQLVETDVAIVPVTNFRSGRTVARTADVEKIRGGSGTWTQLALVEADADAILAALGVQRDDLGDSLVTLPSAEKLREWLPKHRKALAFLRADDVDESVRTLSWGSKSLFGVDRVASLDDWPLTARLLAPADTEPRYRPDTAWTLVAGGDILLDRGVALAIKAKGVDFPFDGGTVDITGICKDCSPFGWDLPYTDRTGNKGAVRALINGADLAIANFENPAPDVFRFHGKGTVFTANPAYIKGLRNVGIDWVSLANNHIGDAGRAGMLQTIRNVKAQGIAYAGLGKNDKAAHKAAILDAGGVKVGLLGYDAIAKAYASGPTTPGSARLTAKWLKKDIKAAREAGADVVIVMPHWGIEYRSTPFAGQQKLARAAIDAGADMVIGNHAHWAGALEVHDGKPIWYALGNFVFDQTWSIPTLEGITLELTFNGKDLVQAKMRPHLILDKAQPNFLDPLGDGKAVLSQIFRASKGLLDW